MYFLILICSLQRTSGLVYADIGQSSCNRQQSHLTSTHLLDDDAVEYARLNHNLPVTSMAVKTNVEPTENSMISDEIIL